MKKHVLLIWGIIFLISLPSIAQTGKFYSSDKELSNSLINNVYQDKRGFIWIATEDGLNKFDGNKFTIYRHDPTDSLSLANNYVKTILEDRKNRFWVLCVNGAQLYKRDTDSFHKVSFQLKEGKISPHISSIIERKNEDIWIGTYGQGILHYQNGVLIPNDEINSMTGSYYIHTIYEDREGSIWIASQDKGLFCYVPRNDSLLRFTAPHQLTSEDISYFCEDKNGNLFVSTLNGGLMKYNRENSSFQSIPYKGRTDLNIKTLMTNKENILYIGTEGEGLKQYDHYEKCIVDCDINVGIFDLTNSKVHSIVEDNEGSLWLGIFQKGLVFIPALQNKFSYYGYKSYKRSSIGSSCIMSIYRDNAGLIWVATDNDGLYAIDDDGVQRKHYKGNGCNRSAPHNIMRLFEDSKKQLWIGSYFSGLAKIDKETGLCIYISEFSNMGNRNNKEKVYHVIEDKNHYLWVGTYGSGIYKMSLNGDVLANYQSDKMENDDWSIDQLCNDWVNCLFEDDEGLLWIGTNNGLSCFNPDRNTFINFFSQNNLLPNSFVHVVLQDSKGKIWIGTSEGLYVFDKAARTFKVFTTLNGLPSNVICGIVEDDKGDFWISTHQGISKYSPVNDRFVNYYSSDGIQGNEFTRGAFFKDRRGKIYFGGTSGITAFYPQDITEQKKKLKVAITDFMIANESIKKGYKSGSNIVTDTLVMDSQQFTLAHDHNSFTLEFSTMEFLNPEKIIYQYKLEGLDYEWMKTNPGVNRITYTNLQPGKYNLMVRAQDNENISDIRTAKILITPPWYQTTWATFIWVLLTCLLMYAVVMYILSRVRHKQELMELAHQEEISEAKLQFFINISHEIRTPMTLIISPLEKLIAEGNQEKQPTYLMIYRNAQRILRLINQLMDIRKLDKGQMHLKFRETDIVGFIDDLTQTFEYQAERKKIKFVFEHEDKELKVWVDLNNFDKVLLNVLSNAFKYTPEGGEITIKLTHGTDETARGALKRYFEITVTDTGIGIDKDKIEQIFERFYQINNDVTKSNFGTGIGLHLSRSLVELHHGTIKAENRDGIQGTQFIIRLPLGSDHLRADELENPQEIVPIAPVRQLNNTENVPEEIIHEHKKVKSKTRFRVLVVEDDDEIRHYIKDELSDEFRIAESVNGKIAWEYILKEKPDLVISDIMMPEMDGITLAKKMKQNIHINHIPIVLLTAKSKTEDRIEGLETGADAYIVKPFNSEVLRTTIHNLIGNRERLKTKFATEKELDEKIVKIEKKSSDEILMEKVIKTINEHLADSTLNVEMLAANVGMSRVHMHRKLKELTNQSARDFIRNIRLKQAATLLKENKLNVSEIAYATGFSNVSHFSNSFKELYGMSPSEYKEQGKPGSEE